MTSSGELSACLRTWRDRIGPEEAGLQSGGARRAPGLRREEVAALAGVSVDYLTRLEQGRATNPSPSVVAALARALRLTDNERDHLFRVAGQAPPQRGTIDRHVTPGVQRVLDRLADVPVTVLDASWTVVSQNALAAALLGDISGLTGRDRNLVWRHFTAAPSRVTHEGEERDRFAAEAVADLHYAAGRYPDDVTLAKLVADLREASPRFAALWDQRPVAPRVASRKTFEHPEVGRLTLDCDVLRVEGSDLRLVVYTTVPGSPDAAALELLGTIGLQTWS
jgi:transcriptional regulator with XRE-family HTH domain